MKILAFLQNQWAKDPARMAEFYDQPGHNDNLDWRAEMNRRLLFSGCLTGRRLSVAFGEDDWLRSQSQEITCRDIIWENASKQVGGHSSSLFPADKEHIRAVIEHHKPDIVIVFGVPHRDVAELVCEELFGKQWCILHRLDFPHPAGRRINVGRLHEWGDQLTSLVEAISGETR